MFGLAAQAGQPVDQTAGHRRAYLDYEGEVSNNRGRVKRVKAGTVQIIATAASELKVCLDLVGSAMRTTQRGSTAAVRNADPAHIELSLPV